MTSARQITLDGSEVAVVNARRQPRLTGTQLEIMRLLREQGHIRSVEAGAIVHHNHDPQWSRKYWSTDGLEALKRLANRGLVQRDPDKRGRWLPT